MVPYEQQVCTKNIAHNRTYSCTTRGSSKLAWTSAQFIGGDGSRLEFPSFVPLGTIKQSQINRDVKAVLLRNEMIHGVQILTCNLTIPLVFLSSFKTYSIVCLNTGLDTMNGTVINVEGVYLYILCIAGIFWRD